MRKLAITLTLIVGMMLSSNGAFALERMALLKADANAKGPIKSVASHKLMESALPIAPARQMMSKLKKADPATKLRVDKSFGKLPLRFEKNDGQTADEVKFLSRGKGYTMYLTPTESVMALTKVIDASKANRDRLMDREPTKTETSVVRMEVVGGNPRANITGEEQLPGTSNYFIGNDKSQWRQAVPNYAKVRYEEVYPGIDLVYYGNQRKLEYDFVVKPGADPQQIALKFKGTENLSINDTGDLVLKTKTGKVIQHAPIIYQTIDGRKQPVDGSYKIESDKVTFQLAQYDTNRDLIIDPVIGFSTYLGGNNLGINGADLARDIAVDSSGNVYVAGYTGSSDFDTLNPIEGNSGVGVEHDVFVFKLEVTENVPSLAFSTYLGGNDSDLGLVIALDDSANVYVAGETRSTDFDTVNSIEGASGDRDIFVFKLEQTNNVPSPAFSTYLGGSASDRVGDMVLDSLGNIYVSGSTSSTDFDTKNEIEGDSDSTDVFVFKLEQTNNVPSLAFSTYLGGNGGEGGNALAVDASGNVYVAGATTSTDFDMVNSIVGFTGDVDAFVFKMEVTNNIPSLAYSTYLEGNRRERVTGMAIDNSGSVYVTGYSNHPVNPNDPNDDGDFTDVIVFKLEETANVPSLVYFEHFGGGGTIRLMTLPLAITVTCM